MKSTRIKDTTKEERIALINAEFRTDYFVEGEKQPC